MSILTRVKPKHLDLLVKIAETRQLQRAAASAAMSQPAASRILGDLETEFGAAFFVRHPTGMELTAAGEVIIQHARVILSEIDTMYDEVRRLSDGDLGQVRVGAVTGPTPGHLMPAVQALLKTSPDIRVSVDVAPSAVLFRGLEEARYDFILGRANPSTHPQNYRYHPGRSEVVTLMVHRSHPLAGKPLVGLAELTDFSWVIQEEGSPIREAVEEAFHAASVPVPSRIVNSSSLLVALARVAEGKAIAPQTEEVMRLLTSEKIDADLTPLNTRTQITVAPYFVIQNAHRNLSQAAERLLAEVLSRF